MIKPPPAGLASEMITASFDLNSSDPGADFFRSGRYACPEGSVNVRCVSARAYCPKNYDTKLVEEVA